MNGVRWLVVILMVVLFVAGCDPVVEIRVMTDKDLTATSPVTSISTAEGPTAIPDTPQPSATPSPTESPATAEVTVTAAIPPTATVTPSPSPTARRLPTPSRPRPTPTAISESGATRIRFQTGAISATVSGQLGPGESNLYVLWAAAGQLMEITLASAKGGVSFAIWGEDGTVLKQHAENRAECVLPSSQDYFIALYAGAPATNYDLTVRISPREASEVTRIRFASGATSALQEGRLEPGDCAYYVLRALEGQKMEVQVSPGEVVGLEVLGQDGSMWSPGPEGILVVEQLPQTGDYYLTLCTPSWARATPYTLEVTIPPR